MRYLGKHFEVAVSLRAVETIPEGQKKKQKKNNRRLQKQPQMLAFKSSQV